jgi:hypothetical protein
LQDFEADSAAGHRPETIHSRFDNLSPKKQGHLSYGRQMPLFISDTEYPVLTAVKER